MQKRPKKCMHPNCFECPYQDCRWDGDDKFYNYNHSEKGKIRTKRYEESDKGQQKAERYRKKQIMSGKNALYCRRYYRRRKKLEFVYNAIVKYIQEHGYAPTVRELCEITGYKSTSSVQKHLESLRDKGMIESDVDFKAPRAIRVVGYKFVKEEEAKNEQG